MTDIPSFLYEKISAAFDTDQAERIFSGFETAQQRPITLRANTLRTDADYVAKELESAGLSFVRVGWYEDAFVMDPNVRLDELRRLPIYETGAVYLQSLSSMLPPLALAPRSNTDILDMCAAPGGKTTELAAIDPTARITACEMHAPRAERLQYNLKKLGATNVQVMRSDARRLDEFFSFDHILLDAPCTGSGTVRAGDTTANERITERLLNKVVRSQQALLDRALTILKPGGTLLYSTCSILPEENDEQVLEALSKKRHRTCSLVALDPSAWNAEPYPIPLLLGGQPETLSIAPTKEFEGFYMALIKKEYAQ
ncbi:RsmB/NOP family class I SAM-dependent RNA methyltransferase [Collinsella ureilytica]|nr:RsmB/NOP family class I SAM-dependent RNA methyltransferase [Collinsella urealyticum]